MVWPGVSPTPALGQAFLVTPARPNAQPPIRSLATRAIPRLSLDQVLPLLIPFTHLRGGDRPVLLRTRPHCQQLVKHSPGLSFWYVPSERLLKIRPFIASGRLLSYPHRLGPRTIRTQLTRQPCLRDLFAFLYLRPRPIPSLISSGASSGASISSAALLMLYGIFWLPMLPSD